MAGYRQSHYRETHHILGSATGKMYPAINLSKVWTDMLPPSRLQNRGFETDSCVDFTITAQIYAVMKQMGFNPDQYSVRALAIMAHTNVEQGGTSPDTAYDAVRNQGMIKESSLPFDDSIKTIDQFFSPKQLTFSLQAEGFLWVDTYTVYYQWLWLGNPPDNWREIINDNLDISPVAISVDAWTHDSNGVYIRVHPFDDHFTLCIADSIVFDSYQPFQKQISEGMKPGEASIIRIIKTSRLDPFFAIKQWISDIWRRVLAL